MKKTERGTTFLGQGTLFEGTLSFHGTARIDGHFKGEIVADGNLIVGDNAHIEATISTSYILISGEVHGEIIASRRVDIRSPAKVYANIQSPSVVMGEGALFWGQTRMDQDKETYEKRSALIRSDEYASGPPPNITALYGIVADQATGNPIKHAEVTCKGPGKVKAETNASGYYELTDLENGTWKVKIAAKGYKKATARIDMPGKESYEQNFQLQPKSKEQQPLMKT